MKAVICGLALLMLIPGCKNDVSSTVSTRYVGGIYDVVDLRQRVQDSYGSDDITEATEEDGWMIGIQQSTSVVNFFDCFDNLMEDGRVSCDMFGEDYTNFGPMVKSVTGEMLFSEDGNLSVNMLIQVYYTSIGFWGTNDLQIEAQLNTEYTEMLKEAFEEAF